MFVFVADINIFVSVADMNGWCIVQTWIVFHFCCQCLDNARITPFSIAVAEITTFVSFICVIMLLQNFEIACMICPIQMMGSFISVYTCVINFVHNFVCVCIVFCVCKYLCVYVFVRVGCTSSSIRSPPGRARSALQWSCDLYSCPRRPPIGVIKKLKWKYSCVDVFADFWKWLYDLSCTEDVILHACSVNVSISSQTFENAQIISSVTSMGSCMSCWCVDLFANFWKYPDYLINEEYGILHVYLADVLIFLQTQLAISTRQCIHPGGHSLVSDV